MIRPDTAASRAKRERLCAGAVQRPRSAHDGADPDVYSVWRPSSARKRPMRPRSSSGSAPWASTSNVIGPRFRAQTWTEVLNWAPTQTSGKEAANASTVCSCTVALCSLRTIEIVTRSSVWAAAMIASSPPSSTSNATSPAVAQRLGRPPLRCADERRRTAYHPEDRGHGRHASCSCGPAAHHPRRGQTQRLLGTSQPPGRQPPIRHSHRKRAPAERCADRRRRPIHAGRRSRR
jgi:hypothetical protein